MANVSIVILAAGQGTRMKSALPKVLHTLAGKALLEHVINTASDLGVSSPVVVYGHGGEQVCRALSHYQATWVEQKEQLGTGHALLEAMPSISGRHLLVLYGDVPLISTDTLKELNAQVSDASMGLLTVQLDNPAGYGRIIRDANGNVERIVEHKDASADELRVHEVNTGILAVSTSHVRRWLNKLDNQNAQGEYYLTDIIAMAAEKGVKVKTVAPGAIEEVMGVNDRSQLAQLERYYQMSKAEELMKAGVTLRDPARFDLRGTLKTGQDVTIDINVIIEGDVVLGDRVNVGPNIVIRNSTVGDDVMIDANCVIDEATIAAGCRIGPFARLRPETVLAENVHIGNFVEIKKSNIGEYSKVNHLSYIGDTTMGRHVNIGAGTITCNYDGANKHRTIIGDNVFVGSDTQFIAPVEIGNGATIGAGSTITQNAPPNELTLSRSKQQTLSGWKRPTKK